MPDSNADRPPVIQLTPAELQQRISDEQELLLLDVREPEEWEICRIEGSTLIPLGELSVRISELDPDAAIVVICHHGVRSSHAAQALARLDFTCLYNLLGGVERWARDVDPSMPRY